MRHYQRDQKNIATESQLGSDTDLSTLLAGARQRDEGASKALAERLYPLVAKVAHAHVPRMEDPEDLVQEIYMKVFSKLYQFRGEVPFEHWVGRIARTTCIDRLRRRRVRPEWRWSDLSVSERMVIDRLEHVGPVPDSDASTALALIEKLLSTLNPDDAWLIRAIDLEERTLADLCGQTDWNPSTARVRLHRARKRLKKAFETLENSEKRDPSKLP